ncbi:hypothetical protein ACE3MZ_13480 [Paenibacillus sp. WLX1005]|uniref:hypothetical protein n=1 Tax=unclassified Paenibacillus TaxID=185978 RepID=UPI003983DBC4
MKKVLMVFMAFTLFFASLGIASDADARRGGGGFKSQPKSYTNTPNRADNNSGSVNSTNRSGTNSSTAGTTGKRGFFSGGSFFTGLMVGGLAGMLFGGMFANMGFMGDFLGLLVNLAAIYVLFIAARGIYRMIRQRKKPADPYDRR